MIDTRLTNSNQTAGQHLEASELELITVINFWYNSWIGWIGIYAGSHRHQNSQTMTKGYFGLSSAGLQCSQCSKHLLGSWEKLWIDPAFSRPVAWLHRLHFFEFLPDHNWLLCNPWHNLAESSSDSSSSPFATFISHSVAWKAQHRFSQSLWNKSSQLNTDWDPSVRTQGQATAQGWLILKLDTLNRIELFTYYNYLLLLLLLLYVLSANSLAC